MKIIFLYFFLIELKWEYFVAFTKSPPNNGKCGAHSSRGRKTEPGIRSTGYIPALKGKGIFSCVVWKPRAVRPLGMFSVLWYEIRQRKYSTF